jgi:hypothetical protein
MIRGLRRRRLTVGLVVAYSLILNLLVSVLSEQKVVATASLDALLAQQICATSEDAQHHPVPPLPGHHKQDCAFCGTSCPMGGCAPVGPSTPRLLAVAPALAVARIVFGPTNAIDRGATLYPSDAVSQAPPHAA